MGRLGFGVFLLCFGVVVYVFVRILALMDVIPHEADGVFWWPTVILTAAGVLLIIAGAMPKERRIEPVRTCLGCGRQMKVDYAICPYCGRKVGVESQSK